MKWRYDVPTVGPEAAKDHWIVVVPVVYSIAGSAPVSYGKWHAYVPGPERNVPWARDNANADSDAVTEDGAPFVRDPRFVLKTAQGGGGGNS